MSDESTLLSAIPYVEISAIVLMLLGGCLAWGPGGGLFAIGLGVLLLRQGDWT